MGDDELFDDFERRMSGDDLRRFFEIREQLEAHASTMRELEGELETLIVKYQLLADIQPCGAAATEKIRANVWWAKTPSDWQCPCCKRPKSDIIRRDRSGQFIGHLTAHHDHFREFLDNVEVERAKTVTVTSELDASATRFLRRFTEGLTRFDEIVICQDCNIADAAAKKLVSAPTHLTFTPSEISRFIIVTPNEVHRVDEPKLRGVYIAALAKYELRKRSAENLAHRVLDGSHWHEHVAWPDRPETINGTVESDLRLLGFHEGARAATVERLIRPSIRPSSNHMRWRTKQRTAGEKPTATEIDYIVRRYAERWNSVPEDWRCPACDRTKHEIIRPTKQFQWMFVLDEARFVDIDGPYGDAKIVICDACRQTIKDFNQEVRHTAEIGAQPLPYLALSDLRRIVRPQPHGLNNIDGDAVEDVLRSLQQAARAYDFDDFE
jgi:rubredoxin